MKKLKRHVLSDPETRSDAIKLGNEISTMFGKIDRFSYDVMNEEMSSSMFNHANQKKMDKKKKQNTVRELQGDQKMRKAFNTV